MKNLLLFILLAGPIGICAQKKIIDHTAYNDWKRIGDIQLSADGNYAVYTIKPLRGDGYLYIVNNETGRKDSVFRGINPVFAGDNSFVAFKITPGFDTLHASELNKIKKDKWPKDSLGIFLLGSDSLVRIPKVKSFYVSKDSDWLAYLSEGNELPAAKKKKRLFGRKKKKEPEYESDGNVLTVIRPSVPGKFQSKDVTEAIRPEKGDQLAYVVHRKEKIDSFELRVHNVLTGKEWAVPRKFNAISDITFNREGTALAFVASLDTLDEGKSYQLYYADLSANSLTKLIDTVQPGLPAGYRVSEHRDLDFSWDGRRLFFGIAPTPVKEPKDTLLESEKAKLDVWSWKDDRLQPQQLVELVDDQEKTGFGVLELSDGSFRTFSDTLGISLRDHGNSDFALAWSVEPYETAYNWDYPNKRDYYRVDLRTGEMRLLGKALIYGTSLSPSGRYFWFFKRGQQYLLDLDNDAETCITCNDPQEEWLEDVNGMPVTPSPYGALGWTRGEKQLILQSKYDLWAFDPEEEELVSLTSHDGRDLKIRFSLFEWDSDSTYIDFDNTYITGFHELDKSMTLYAASLDGNKLELARQLHTQHALSGFRKAEKSDRYVFQKYSVKDYPDAYTGRWKVPGDGERISVTNPQQSEYNWATVELVSWKSYDGTPLEGLLYKPENYDYQKKYPLLVYYYELYSDDLHSHYAPKPTASIIFPTEYASAGYFVFIPDIRYKTGHPGQSAYDCIMSGTDNVLKLYPSIDSTRMGLQGQSWGGYQTAQLITMTNRYKAAMAGAPVANMFSAYGGIRWGSGLNRQFQYERTQSRIGKTIWEAPELYVENSPLFHLPNVQTPLLIMHNDGDGSVPWYQGVELFTGLKRLGKPVWLLNYNGDDHNLMKNANRIDLSIRMRQYFDFYLMGAPEPAWMKTGVPAVKKGKEYGLSVGDF